MFKILILALVVCAANAGVIGLGGHGVAVAAVHGATSYQNYNQVSVHPVPVVASHAVAAPVAVAHSAPLVGIAHGGLGIGHSGLGIGHSGLGIGHSGLGIGYSGLGIGHGGLGVH